MNIKLSYRWFEHIYTVVGMGVLTFLFMAFFWWGMIISLPLLWLSVIFRLERKQLIRNVLLKIYSIGMYLEEIAEIEGKAVKMPNLNVVISEEGLKNLSIEERRLSQEYTRLCLIEIVARKEEDNAKGMSKGLESTVENKNEDMNSIFSEQKYRSDDVEEKIGKAASRKMEENFNKEYIKVEDLFL